MSSTSIDYLIHLHQRGKISDAALDAMLEGAQLPQQPILALRQKRERPTTSVVGLQHQPPIPAPCQNPKRPIPALHKKPLRPRLLTVKEFDGFMAWLLEDDKLTFMQPPWVIGYFLRGWQMDVPGCHQVKADLKAFLGGIRPQIHQKRSYLSKKSSSSLLKLQLRKDNPDGSKEYTDPVLCHKQEAVLNANKIDGALDKAFPYLLELFEKWTQRGSGWVVGHVGTLWLDIACYQSLRGGSYIPLPPAVKTKRDVANVHNKCDNYLLWALRSALFPAAENTHRPTKYPKNDGLHSD